MGKATVVTPPPLEGLRAAPGEHLLVADSASEWVGSLSRLFEDSRQRRRLGAAGRAYVAEHHCWDRCLAPLAGLLGLPPSPSAGRCGDE